MYYTYMEVQTIYETWMSPVPIVLGQMSYPACFTTPIPEHLGAMVEKYPKYLLQFLLFLSLFFTSRKTTMKLTCSHLI